MYFFIDVALLEKQLEVNSVVSCISDFCLDGERLEGVWLYHGNFQSVHTPNYLNCHRLKVGVCQHPAPESVS